MDFKQTLDRARELIAQRNDIDRQLAELKQLTELLNGAKPKRTRKKKEKADA